MAASMRVEGAANGAGPDHALLWARQVTASTRMGNTGDSSADNMGFRCALTVPGGPKRKPRGYVYDQHKKKRPPPGVGDPLKDGGKSAEDLVQVRP